MQSHQHKQSKAFEPRQAVALKWLGIKLVDYEIDGKIIKDYEMVFRTTTESKGYEIDGVDIIPILKYKNAPSKLLLIANFRPPVGKFVLEFPAGLMDKGTLKENAEREVKQQTGYNVSKFIEFPTPKYYSDPWKSNECSKLLIAIIDGDSSQKPVQDLQKEENIRVHLLNLDNTLREQIQQLQTKYNYEMEAKVWCLALGAILIGMTQ